MVVVTHAEAGGSEEVAKTLGLQRRGFQRRFAAWAVGPQGRAPLRWQRRRSG